MESDISELIETAASTNNEGNEEDSIPVESVDEEEIIEDGFDDEEPVLYEPESGSMESQSQSQGAVVAEAVRDYEREGQVIVRYKTWTKRPRYPRVRRQRKSGISRQQRRGSNGKKGTKRCNLS